VKKLPGAPDKSWMMWVAAKPGVFGDKELRLLACTIVRTTPTADGQTVWDLLTDERSRAAIDVAERYANSEATDEELSAAWADARAAAWGIIATRCSRIWGIHSTADYASCLISPQGEAIEVWNDIQLEGAE